MAGQCIAAVRCSTAIRWTYELSVAKLQEYSPQQGPDFKLSPLLERLAAEGRGFQDLK
jgi:hypothetical protein